MNKYLRSLALLCSLLILLSGCGKTIQDSMSESQTWNQWPRLTNGEASYEKLQALPWDSGRCEATSFYSMAETALGYYLSYFGILYYADKTDLSNWVIVCNAPDCNHLENIECNGYIGAKEFLVKDDRILIQPTSGTKGLYSSKAAFTILASMGVDGADWRFAYALEEAETSSIFTYNTLLSPEQWLYCTLDFMQDGSLVSSFYRVTADGVKKYPSVEADWNSTASLGWAGYYYALFGDPYFYCTLLGTDESKQSGEIFRFEGDTLKTLDVSNIPYDGGFTGGYISGDTMRCFRRNDGYYDVNLITGEEIKLMDAQLENSHCYLVLPNCMIETTLRYSTIPYRTEGMSHTMKLFDGEHWYPVELPKELLHTDADVSLRVQAVVSDGIILSLHRGTFMTELPLYHISLDSEEKALRYIGSVYAPLPPKDN